MTIDELNALTTLTAADEVPVWDAEASSEPTKKITAQHLASSIKTLESLLGTGDVVNNLTSTATDKPLAAAQGKALNDLIKNVESVVIQGGGNFGITIIRLGYIRIVYMYNGVDLQAPISIQLDAKDKPVNNVNVGAWLPINDSASAYGSRYLAINQSGILSTSGDVYRGGWTAVYVASSPV